MKALLGKKLGMTQVYKEDKLIPVTVLEVGPCVVSQIKTTENDGYNAVQIGYGAVKDKHLTKPNKMHFQKKNVEPKRHLAEYRIDDSAGIEVGQVLTTEIFQSGDKVDIVSTSKGKGFAGVVKRWGFAGGPGGHGSHFHRAPGSVGMAATPSRVLKGRKLPGQMGSKRVTVKNLKVVDVIDAQDVILVEGAVPGGKNAIVLLKSKNEVAPPRPKEELKTEEKTKTKEVEEKSQKETTKEEVKEAKEENVVEAGLAQTKEKEEAKVEEKKTEEKAEETKVEEVKEEGKEDKKEDKKPEEGKEA